MMGINIITANFSNGGRQSITRKLYQYDYGQKVSIRGLSLPSTFEVHISNDNNINTAEVYTGTKNEIEIPDKFLLSGKAIYMWLFLHNAENDGQTRYIITIPVEERPKPQAAVPVTDENAINQLLIAALQNPQQAKNSTGINIVTANFKNERNTITRKLYQYDYGQVINIKGLNLPKAFEVHISNSNKASTAQIYIGNNDQIEIPNKFLLSGEDIYLWIFLHSTATDGQTRYTITIPVQKKPKPESEEPTEVEWNTIDQLIAALEINLNEMRQATEDAKTAMDQATAAAKEQMQLAIDKANDTVSKYPKIIEDYWYIYDVENQVWVNTQIKALAVDGVGIENIVYNNDYTITINLTDGTSYTTESIRGQKGEKGDTGATPNIKIQSTETLAPNQYANVTISGTPEEPKLIFKIPKGEKGDKGDTGAMPQISIGTVETLLPHRVGYVTQTGTTENPVLNFGLVKGETGQAGKTAYEYAIENGYSGNENDFSNALANLATLQEVDRAIAEAMGDITGFEFQIVQNLPITGEKGIIYLVPHSHGTGDIYDEYIWVTNGFEKIGSTDIDLSDYLQISDIAEWAKTQTKPVYTAAEVGAIGIEQLSQAIDSALAQAKKSGEFNGPQGETGLQGPKGDTGEKGDKGDTGEKGDKGDTGEVSVEQLATALATKADIIINSASGAIASFKDGADDLPMKSAVVNIEPIQEGSGDPSPENVRPISGRTGLSVARTGINVWNEEWEKGAINAQSGSPANIANRIRSKNFSSCRGGVKYYIHSEFGVTHRIFWYDSDRNYITYQGGQNFVTTSPNNARYFKVSVEGNTYGETYRHDISINYPSTDTEYRPYKGNTYSVNWETEAGTVYGGYVDVVSGKLVVDSAYLEPTSTIIGANSTWAPGRYSINLSDYGYPLDHGWEADPVGLYCDKLLPIRRKAVGSSTPYTISYDIGTAKLQFFLTSDISTREKAREWITNNPIQIVYRLKEPFEIQLTTQEICTLLGENNIWSDGGDAEVEYPADTKLYIDQKITEAIAAAMA